MEKLHYMQEMKYLRAVADHLIAMGYEVEEPSTKHRDLLDVWGTFKGKRCFIEIYVTIHPCHGGIHGIWHQGEHEGVEIFLHPEFGLQTSDYIGSILDGLKPFKKKKKLA